MAVVPKSDLKSGDTPLTPVGGYFFLCVKHKSMIATIRITKANNASYVTMLSPPFKVEQPAAFLITAILYHVVITLSIHLSKVFYIFLSLIIIRREEKKKNGSFKSSRFLPYEITLFVFFGYIFFY